MRGKSLRLLGVAFCAAAVTALVLVVSAGAGSGHRGGHKGLKAKLTGAAEVPGPGDADGRGRARIVVLKQFDSVCFRLRWRDIAAPDRAHIHKGSATEAGPIVVNLDEDGVKERGCVDGLDRALLRDIKRNPGDYYVNIHNPDFPAGAIRGQLSRKGGGHRGGNKN